MKDPVAKRSGDEDLYDIASWEPRTALDRLAVRTYRGVVRAGRRFVVGLGVLILLVILGASGAGGLIIRDPFILGLALLSIIPAAGLALYIYRADITTKEPPSLLVATFVLSILFAGFAAVINSMFGFLQLLPLVGFILFYYLVVGPVEESVKLLAVWLYPYRDSRFDSVVDGAVYGAIAGLGFAAIENVLYITQNLQTPGAMLIQTGIGVVDGFADTLEAGGQITAVRGLAGPGHVVYSAFAGYYLGLSKFNRENAGPIVVKGLLIAAFIHATYNTLVGIVPGIVSLIVPGVPVLVLFFGFVVVFQGVFFYILYRKLKRYEAACKRSHDDVDTAADFGSELTEFDPEMR
ncbi:PrsW family intramembrane metalloprotease [Natronomonas salsuginis]|jgi:RsiW-degrading membrane proteinase PrsW (M82 family)|uniref:PrsW family intramembrane metalloprotease n=1 Tax=Natronomonas salsuginis TaxID=2217661 RepID=A0A4U5JCM7_9EURY|nr:PrsW family intramembrane metalloprotease [Natronomonas salsuginis]TKR25628.1 PrsW family intramembrane metalloprotease [Natronomonas salsuginis]